MSEPLVEGSPNIRWSLVTVTYNSAAVLQSHWSGIKFGEGVDWIVVDNNSSDDSVEVAESLGAQVHALERNLGFGAANNIGFRSSTSDFVAFINPDVTPEVESLDILAQHCSREDALVAPQLVNPDGSVQPNGRGWPYFIFKVLNRVAPSSITRRYHVFAKQGQVVPTIWAIGAAVAGRRDLLAELGPWDEKFFLYYEDSDLCLRARKLGHDTLLVGDARWVHAWARETASWRWQPWKREFASMAKFYARYPQLLNPLPFSRALRMESGQ